MNPSFTSENSTLRNTIVLGNKLYLLSSSLLAVTSQGTDEALRPTLAARALCPRPGTCLFSLGPFPSKRNETHVEHDIGSARGVAKSRERISRVKSLPIDFATRSTKCFLPGTTRTLVRVSILLGFPFHLRL